MTWPSLRSIAMSAPVDSIASRKSPGFDGRIGTPFPLRPRFTSSLPARQTPTMPLWQRPPPAPDHLSTSYDMYPSLQTRALAPPHPLARPPAETPAPMYRDRPLRAKSKMAESLSPSPHDRQQKSRGAWLDHSRIFRDGQTSASAFHTTAS